MRATVSQVDLHAVDLLLEDPPWESRLSDLSPEERARADRFAFPEGRRRFVVGRSTLRRLLAERLAIFPSEVPLIEGPHGKPALAELPQRMRGPRNVGFNLTHCGELALIAIGPGDVGVDLESVYRSVDSMAIVRRFFSDQERAGFESLPEGAARDLLFFRVWTRKEAVVKAVGRGLSCPLSSFTVPLEEIPKEGVLLDCPEKSGRRWRLFEIGEALDLGEDWVAALVTS